MIKSGIRKFARGYISFCDSINRQIKYVGYGLLVMTFIMTYEVIARYIFNSPTRWAWEINEQLLCFFTVLAGGYVLLNNGHTRMDVFSAKWSRITNSYVQIFTSLLGFIFLGAFLYGSTRLVFKSIAAHETSVGLLGLPLTPIRVIVVIGTVLFIIQLIAEVIRNILVITDARQEKMTARANQNIEVES